MNVTIRESIFGGAWPYDVAGRPLLKLIGDDGRTLFKAADGTLLIPPAGSIFGTPRAIASAAFVDSGDPLEVRRPSLYARQCTVEGVALRFDHWSNVARPPLSTGDPWSRERYIKDGMNIGGPVTLRIGHSGREVASTLNGSLSLSVEPDGWGGFELSFRASVAECSYIDDLRRYQTLAVSTSVIHDEVQRLTHNGSPYANITRSTLRHIALLAPGAVAAFEACYVKVAG